MTRPETITDQEECGWLRPIKIRSEELNRGQRLPPGGHRAPEMTMYSRPCWRGRGGAVALGQQPPGPPHVPGCHRFRVHPSPLRFPLLRCRCALRGGVCAVPQPRVPAAPVSLILGPRFLESLVNSRKVLFAILFPVGNLQRCVSLPGDTVPHLSYGRIASSSPRAVSWCLLGPAVRGGWLVGSSWSPGCD